VSQRSTKPVGGDQSFSTEGFPLISISVQLLSLIVTQGRVLHIILCAVVSRDVASVAAARREVPAHQRADDWCSCAWYGEDEPSII
jgi:hypothetical protein